MLKNGKEITRIWDYTKVNENIRLRRCSQDEVKYSTRLGLQIKRRNIRTIHKE